LHLTTKYTKVFTSSMIRILSGQAFHLCLLGQEDILEIIKAWFDYVNY